MGAVNDAKLPLRCIGTPLLRQLSLQLRLLPLRRLVPLSRPVQISFYAPVRTFCRCSLLRNVCVTIAETGLLSVIFPVIVNVSTVHLPTSLP
jgi:hypothetical protein